MKKKPKREPIKLPTEKTTPSEALSDYSIWIYGAPKIGKTTLSDVFPDTLHLMFEDGVKALELFKVQIERWADVPDVVKEIYRGKHEFQNVAVDVVEAAYELCLDHVCADMGIEHPGDAEYGKGWKAVRDEFMTYMLKLTRIPGVGCVFISHASITSRKTYEGEEVSDIHPALTGKPLEYMSGAMDIIGYYTFRRGERVLQIRGDDNVMAGCRVPERFLYADGKEIKYVPLGKTAEEAYRNLELAFENKLEPPTPEKNAKSRLRLKRRGK
jgi:hypothetical protein